MSHPIRQAGAFKKNFSSPLLTIDPLGAVREAPAAQGECMKLSGHDVTAVLQLQSDTFLMILFVCRDRTCHR